MLARVSHSEALGRMSGPGWKVLEGFICLSGASVIRPLSPLVTVGFLTAQRSPGVSYGRWFLRGNVQYVKAKAASLKAQPQEVTQHHFSLHIIKTSHKGSPDSEGGMVA